MNKKLSKFLITSASAAALLAAYPAIAQNVEVFDAPVVSAQTVPSAVRAFVSEGQKIPSVAEILTLSPAEISTVRNQIGALTVSHSRLSAADKKNPSVVKWAGYLALKSEAIGNDYVELAKNTLSVAQIEALDSADVDASRNQFGVARAAYNKLSANVKANEHVNRWAGYLVAKETAVGTRFIDQAQSLPSLSAIAALTDDQLEAVKAEAASVRAAFDALTDNVKNAPSVARWAGYLAQKEEAIEMAGVVEIVEVSAINSKGLAVTFNQEIDTDKAEITVKKGSVTVNVDSLDFADDKESVKITTASKLTKGEYTVIVSGLTDEDLTETVTVEDEKVSEINVTSDVAPMNKVEKKQAYVDYEVLNQYGEEMKHENINWTISTGEAVVADTNRQLTIKNAGDNAFIPGSKVYITGVHGMTGTVVNAEVTIGLESKADVADIKGVYDTKKDELSTLPANFANDNYVLLFQVKDQYGNDMTTSDLTDFSVLSTNTLFVKPGTLGSTVTIDDVDYYALKLVQGDQVDRGGDATIRLISNNSGKQAGYEVTAEAATAVEKVSIGSPDVLVAGGETVEIPFEAYDQYGNEITKHKDLENKVDFTGVTLKKLQDGSAKLEYTAPANATKNNTVQTISSLVKANGNFSSAQITVRPNAETTTVIGLNEKVSTKIASGAEVELGYKDIVVEDQYGRTMSNDKLKAWLNTDNANSIVIESEVKDVVRVVSSENTGDNDADKQFNFITKDGDKFTITGGVDRGTEKLVISLSAEETPVAEEVIGSTSKTVTFTNVVQSAYVSYEVADLGVMYNNADDDSETTSTEGYIVTPKVYGITEAGDKVLLPASLYTMTNDGQLDTTTTEGKIKDLNVGGYETTDFEGENNNPKDIKVNVTFLIVDEATGAAAATIEKELVVTNEDPEVTEVTFENTVKEGKAFVKTTDVNNGTATALKGFIKEEKDQYGVVSEDIPAITISNVKKVDESGFEVTATTNATGSVEITGATAGDTFTATYKYAGGKTVSVDFTVTE